MPKPLSGSAIEQRLAKVTKICLALPESACERHANHAIFRVRRKVFAYFLNDHDNDGIVSVCVRSVLGENVDRVRLAPERFYLPPYIGPRGWFGLRLDRSPVVWGEVAEVVGASYRLAAPKTLVRRLDAAGS